MWTPGEVLAIDWGSTGPLHVFCAVLAWSRFRFVRFADNERSETTLAMLAGCFEELGGVPKVVLADRMGCLKGGVVANKVVPTADYVRFATHYSFRPDWCEAADPESKGIVENLVGYAKRDLIVPQAPFSDLAAATKSGITGGNPEPPPAPENHGPGSMFPPDPLPASPHCGGSRRTHDRGMCKQNQCA